MEQHLTMKKLLLLLALLAPTEAWAQCTGVFPANTLCGNLTGTPQPPSAFSSGGTISGPAGSTLNGLPIWGNTLGSQLVDGNGNTVAGVYTWGGAQTYSATTTYNSTATFAATFNSTGTFQVGGQTFTWPAAGTAVAGLGTSQTFTGNNIWSGNNTYQTGTFNFTGTFQKGGNTMTFPGVAATLAGLGVNQTWTGVQTFSAGSASQSNFSMGSTTAQTTPAAGGFEYDGNAAYFTPNSSNRGVLPATMILTLSANQTGTNVSTAQPWFPGGGATGLNVAANTTYMFSGHFSMSRAAGGTVKTLSNLFGGTATLTSINYNLRVTDQNSATSTLAAFQTIELSTAAATVIVTGNGTAPEFNTVEIQGLVRINAAGTFIPQFQYSVAPGGAPTIQANTWFSMTPIGSGSVLSVGNWQ